MALPQDGQNANGLTKVTEIPKGKELIFIDPTTNEGGIITLEDLTTQILKNLTSQTFALDQGNMTLLAALNQLNSNTFRISNIDSSSHTITIHRVSKNKTLLHCAILYYTNDCAALINMDMMDGTMTSTKVWSICGPESPTASISNGDLKISIRPWRNVTLIMPGNEFSAALSD